MYLPKLEETTAPKIKKLLGAIHKWRQVFFEDFGPPPTLVRRSQIWWTPLNNDVRFETPLPIILLEFAMSQVYNVGALFNYSNLRRGLPHITLFDGKNTYIYARRFFSQILWKSKVSYLLDDIINDISLF